MAMYNYIEQNSRFRLFKYLEKNKMSNILLIVGNSSSKELLIKNYIDEIKYKYKLKKIIKKSVNPQFEESYKASKRW